MLTLRMRRHSHDTQVKMTSLFSCCVSIFIYSMGCIKVCKSRKTLSGMQELVVSLDNGKIPRE